MRDAWLIARKDLLIEARSRVVLNQVAPFALLVLVLFGFALDASIETETLVRFSPGLFWVTVLFVALLAIQRSVALERVDGAFGALRLTGIDGWRIFVGKSLAVTAQLIVLEALLLFGIIVLYGARVASWPLVIIGAILAAIGISVAGSLYGVLAVGLGVRETLLPILLLPVLAPVLIAATKVFDDALGTAVVNGWAWTSLLAAFAVAYVVAGSLAYGMILEDM